MDWQKFAKREDVRYVACHVVLAVCAVIVLAFAASLLLNVFTRHNRYKTVPDFGGMNIEEVRRMAAKESLRIEVTDSLFVPAFAGGAVLDQNPVAGTKVKSGRRIFVTQNAYRQKHVQVPYVTGYSLRQAKNNLEVAGLGIDKLVYREDIATNYVLEERFGDEVIGPGTQKSVELGSGVTLIVGCEPGKDIVSVPRVTGFPINEARSRLWELGLNVGSVTFDEGISVMERNEAKVYLQEPAQGRTAFLGNSVSLRLTLDGKKVETAVAESEKAAILFARQAEAERRAREDSIAMLREPEPVTEE